MLPWKQDHYSQLWTYELITNEKHNSVWKAATGNQHFNSTKLFHISKKFCVFSKLYSKKFIFKLKSPQ